MSSRLCRSRRATWQGIHWRSIRWAPSLTRGRRDFYDRVRRHRAIPSHSPCPSPLAVDVSAIRPMVLGSTGSFRRCDADLFHRRWCCATAASSPARAEVVADDYAKWFLARLRAVDRALQNSEHLLRRPVSPAPTFSVGYALLLAEHVALEPDFTLPSPAYLARLQGPTRLRNAAKSAQTKHAASAEADAPQRARTGGASV